MKKVALSLIALLAVGTFAFAEDVAAESSAAVKTTLAASATVKYGLDLATKTSGFSHSEDFKLELVILDSKSTKAGTGDVYGSIEVADVKIKGDAEDGTDSSAFGISLGDITAKIIFPNGWFKINENTNAAVGYGVDGDNDNGGATIVADDAFYTYKDRYGAGSTEWKIGTIQGLGVGASNGVALYYELPSFVGVTAEVGSKDVWEKNNDNKYEGSLELSLLAVDKLTFKVKGYAGAGYNGGEGLAQGLGGSVGYDLGLVVPYFNLNTIGAFSQETLTTPTAVYELDTATGKIKVNAATSPSTSYVWDADGAYSADFGTKLALVDGFKANIAATYNSDATINAVVTADLAADKLAGPLSALAGVKLGNLTSSVDAKKTTEVFGKVSVKVDTLTVWGKGSFNSTGAADSTSIFAKIGADVAAFPLTTIGAEWDSSDLGSKKQSGDQTLGQAFVYAKVAY